jgi:hypothetical protein
MDSKRCDKRCDWIWGGEPFIGAKIVLLCMIWGADDNKYTCNLRKLKFDCGMTYAELSENIRELADAGLITIEKWEGKTFDAILNL